MRTPRGLGKRRTLGNSCDQSMTSTRADRRIVDQILDDVGSAEPEHEDVAPLAQRQRVASGHLVFDDLGKCGHHLAIDRDLGERSVGPQAISAVPVSPSTRSRFARGKRAAYRPYV